MSLNPLGGNVGIGTTGPLVKLQVGLDNAGEPATLGSLTPQEIIMGVQNDLTEASLLRLIRPTNSGNLYPASVDFKVSSYAGALGSPYLPKTQLTIGLKASASYDTGDVINVMTLRDSGNVGIGVTGGPSYKLDVVSGGATTARFGTASGDTVVIGGGSGKITVGTVDPAYTINGDKFATYGAEMTGVKGETTDVVDFSGTNFAAGETYSYALDLAGAENGSDLWLFKETTQIVKNNLNGLVVMLTPSFDGDAWYVKDAAKGTVTVFAKPSESVASLEVSYRLTAPRPDFGPIHYGNIGASDAPAGIIIND